MGRWINTFQFISDTHSEELERPQYVKVIFCMQALGVMRLAFFSSRREIMVEEILLLFSPWRNGDSNGGRKILRQLSLFVADYKLQLLVEINRTVIFYSGNPLNCALEWKRSLHKGTREAAKCSILFDESSVALCKKNSQSWLSVSLVLFFQNKSREPQRKFHLHWFSLRRALHELKC